LVSKDDDSDLEMYLGGLSFHKECQTLDDKYVVGGMILSFCGVPKYFMLKVKGLVVGQEVMVLINLGATYNFINEEFVKKNFLKIEFEDFHVTNANGKLNLVEQIVKKFGVSIQEYVAREDF